MCIYTSNLFDPMQAESCMGPHARLSASPTCSLPGSARSPASRSCLVACLRAVLFQLKLQLSLFAFTARQRLVLLLTFVSKTIKRIAKLMLLLTILAIRESYIRIRSFISVISMGGRTPRATAPCSGTLTSNSSRNVELSYWGC